MENKIAGKIKELRNRKGLSQELLAENCGLSLRTIQRIENGETEPRGDSLRRLAGAFGVSPDDLINCTLPEDKNFLVAFNLSALGFLLFPILGILIPLIFWISKKDKLKDVMSVGKEILNFQISWTLLVLVTYIYFVVSMFYRISQAGDISPSLILGNAPVVYGIFGFLYLYNFLLIVLNTINIVSKKRIRYLPKINFVR